MQTNDMLLRRTSHPPTLPKVRSVGLSADGTKVLVGTLGSDILELATVEKQKSADGEEEDEEGEASLLMLWDRGIYEIADCLLLCPVSIWHPWRSIAFFHRPRRSGKIRLSYFV